MGRAIGVYTIRTASGKSQIWF